MFKTMEDVHEYLSGETVECLECGKHLRTLNRHVMIHGMTADHYKLAHGIPWWISLSTQELRVANELRRKNRFLTSRPRLWSEPRTMPLRNAA